MFINAQTHFPTHTNIPLTFLNLHRASMARCWQLGLWGSLCEEVLGLLHAGHRQFHPVPTHPPQGTAEHLSQDSGTSEKTYLRKGRKCWTGRGGRTKESETAEGISRSEKEEEWRRCCWRSTAPRGPHTGEEENGEEEGLAEGNYHVLAITPPTPLLLVPHVASLKGLSVTCSNDKRGREELGVRYGGQSIT